MAKPKYTLLARSTKKKALVIVTIGVLLVVVLILVVIFAIKESDKTVDGATTIPKKYSAKRFEKAAVAADSKYCSDIGADILRKNGNAAESAIATVFCTGVTNIQSTGIGGGGFFLLYERKKKKFTAYDFREVAPLSSNETMYVNKTGASRYGGLSVGVPGMVKGLYMIYEKHGGNIPWADLVEPSIKLTEGIPVSKPVAGAIQGVEKFVKKGGNVSDGLIKLITNEKGEYLRENDLIKNPELGRTLRNIQQNGSRDFYFGDLAKDITRDMQDNGGIITMDDLKSYEVSVEDYFQLNLTNGDVFNTMPLPSGGPIVAMILNIMSGYSFEKIDLSNGDEGFEFWQKLLESMKFAYAQRGLLGDPSKMIDKSNITKVLDLIKSKTVAKNIRENKIFLNETHEASYYGGFWGKNDFGTSHMSLIAENGDAVSCTGTINLHFGSKFRSLSTGIIYNNEMDDFSTPGMVNYFGYPPSPANYIVPGKRPLSSMSPSIVTDKNGDVKIVTGAAGGSRIISATATVIAKVMLLDMELGDSVASYRLHNQGVPNNTFYNYVTPPSALINKLKSIGHTVTKTNSLSVVQAVSKKSGYIYAMTDIRKPSESDGY